MHTLRTVFLSIFLLGFAVGCVFKLPTVQGNVLDEKDTDRIEVGMSSTQVKYVLGTPLLEDPFDPRRWDYVYYYRDPKGDVFQRTMSLYFEGETLTNIERATTETAQITEELVEDAEKDAKENLPVQRPDKKAPPGGYKDDPFESEDPV